MGIPLRQYSEEWALTKAINVARLSPCIKSQRGVVIWNPYANQWVDAFNSPPEETPCSGTATCRSHCNKFALHAEQRAILHWLALHKQGPREQVELLHVKVADLQPVPSGRPSCWQCSKIILEMGFKGIWLLHPYGLQFYSALEFHQLTLQNCGLMVQEGMAIQ